MFSRDMSFFNGSIQIHISADEEYSSCYIYVHDVYSNILTLRYFSNVGEAMKWIDAL